MSTDLGTDIGCVTDIDQSMGLVSGRLNLCHAIARRLSTPRGWLYDSFQGDPDYGLDLREWLNGDFTTSELNSKPSEIEDEVLKDERIQACTVTATFTPATSTAEIQILLEDADGPFSLVLAVSSVTVSLLSVGGLPPAVSGSPAPVRTIQLINQTASQGAPGPAGAAGTDGTDATAAEIQLDDEGEYTTDSTTETVIAQIVGDFSIFGAGASLSARLAASLKLDIDETGGMLRLRVGGTDGAADGDIIAFLVASTLTYAADVDTGTFTNPGGTQLVKLTIDAEEEDKAAWFKGAMASITPA
jgi:hypothetical protein